MLKSDETLTPEAAVRLYLLFLEDPQKLIDRQEVKNLEDEVDKAKDPIAKLKAISALQRAQAVDPASYAYDFIKHARRWAESEGVPVSAFRQMGVPEDVIAAAGFDSSRRGGGRRGRSRSEGAPKRSRVNTEQLMQGILGLEGDFTIRDVSERVGGSPLTVKNTLGMLEAQGKITPAGERSGSRGRAARAWTVTSPS
ncbi:MAG: hypothetical protein QOJ19_464 [Acidimicrobiia bacterium]|jgi:hypothetical protein|nr:hypothetical protein [Acidimicrobiia bacterium]